MGVRRLLLLLAGLSFCRAGDIVFIVSERVEVEKLTVREVRKIFLREKDFIDAITAFPINLPPENPLRKEVESRILGMDEEDLQLFWNRKYLNGIEPPLVLSSQEAVKAFVRKVPGAIGYIDEDLLRDEGLKVVFRLKR